MKFTLFCFGKISVHICVFIVVKLRFLRTTSDINIIELSGQHMFKSNV